MNNDLRIRLEVRNYLVLRELLWKRSGDNSQVIKNSNLKPTKTPNTGNGSLAVLLFNLLRFLEIFTLDLEVKLEMH